ncbi:cysteine protease [Striga asiatica]|uniref:Cysteine protease n=1 Tax=Striga asiatica TaxID=4170 RepID=A0A5A7QMF7_STRAF|nr:cysteine protease [Striga asiatica]
MMDFEWSYDEPGRMINGIRLVREAEPGPKENGLWAHYACTICVESRYRIKMAQDQPPKIVPKLSVQYIVDAVRMGGEVWDVLDWMSFGGLTLESIYPTKGRRQDFHHYLEGWPRFTIQRHLRLEPQNDAENVNEQLLKHLESDGPFVSGFRISANYFSIDHETDVYVNDKNHNPDIEDTASGSTNLEVGDKIFVTVIGEGWKNKISYWVYRNNMGVAWGRHGKGMVDKRVVEDAYVPILA